MSFMTLKHPASLLAIDVLDHPQCIVTGCQNGSCYVWDCASYNLVEELRGHTRAVFSLTHSTSSLLLSASGDTSIRIWNTSGGLRRGDGGGFVCIATLRVGAGIIYSLVVQPTHFFRGGSESHSPASQRHHRSSRAEQLSLFAGCQNTRVYRIDVEVDAGAARSVSVTRNVAFHGCTGFVYSVLLHRAPDPLNAPWLIAGSGDGSIHIWTAWAAAETAARAPPPLAASFVSLALSEGRAETPPPLEASPPHRPGSVPAPLEAATLITISAPVTSYPPLAILRCSTTTTAPAATATTLVVDHDAHALALHKWENCGSINALATHGRDLYAGSQDGVIRVWELDNSVHLKYSLTGHTGEVLALAVCQDPTLPAPPFSSAQLQPQQQLVGGRPPAIRTDAAASAVLVGDATAAVAAAAPTSSRRGAILVSSSADRTVRLWSTRTYMCLRVLDGSGSSLFGSDHHLQQQQQLPHHSHMRSSSSAFALTRGGGSTSHSAAIMALACANGLLFSVSDDYLVRVCDTAVLLRPRGSPGSLHADLSSSSSQGALGDFEADNINLPAQSELIGLSNDVPASGGSAVTWAVTQQMQQTALAHPGSNDADADAAADQSSWYVDEPHDSSNAALDVSYDSLRSASQPQQRGSLGSAADDAVIFSADAWPLQLGASFPELDSTLSAAAPSGGGDARSYVHAGSNLSPAHAARAHDDDLSTQTMLLLLRDFVAIPSVSLDDSSSNSSSSSANGSSSDGDRAPAHSHANRRNVNGCWKAARFVGGLLSQFGAEVRLVQGLPGSNPMVLARLGSWEDDVPTVLLHAHYDVQPPGPDSAWASPPFELTGKDGYLYGRGVTDNKGGILAMIIAAVRCTRSLQQQQQPAVDAQGDTVLPPPATTAASSSVPSAAVPATAGGGRVNFVFCFEGEGENSSRGFRESVLQNLEWFAGCSAIINTNNTWLGENTPCLTYGMRGIVKMKVEVEGAASDLHSGLDGGITHEPLVDLCDLLSSLTEPTTGRIAVAGIYDDVAPLSAEELQLYTNMDFNVAEFMAARGLPGVYSSTNLRVRQAGVPVQLAASSSRRRLSRGNSTAAAGVVDSLLPAAATLTQRGSPDRAARSSVASLSRLETPSQHRPLSSGSLDHVSSSSGSLDYASTAAATSATSRLDSSSEYTSRKLVAARGDADSMAGLMNNSMAVGGSGSAVSAAGGAVETVARNASLLGNGKEEVAGDFTVDNPVSLQFNAPHHIGTNHLHQASLSPPHPADSSSSSSSNGDLSYTDSTASFGAIDLSAVLLLRRWREPSLTVHGISASAANDSIVPRRAVGYVSCRTVPVMTAAETMAAIESHLRARFAARQSVNTLRISLTAHAAWWLESPSAPLYTAAAKAIEKHWKGPPIYVREGGTVRVTTFLQKALRAPALHLPLGQSSDSPHLPNERIRLLNLVRGTLVLESLFRSLALSG